MNTSMIVSMVSVIALPMVSVAVTRPRVFLSIAVIPGYIVAALASVAAWLYLSAWQSALEMAMNDLGTPLPVGTEQVFELARRDAYDQLRRSQWEAGQLGLLTAGLLLAVMVSVLAAVIARRHDAEEKQVPTVPTEARCVASAPAVSLRGASNFILLVRRRRRHKAHLMAALKAARDAKARNNAPN